MESQVEIIVFSQKLQIELVKIFGWNGAIVCAF
jgi:hypothetical protein